MGILIVGGLIWVVAMGPTGGGGTLDPNATFNDDMNPFMGPEGAKVTVRIFSDFQCPACKLAEGPLRQAMEKYKDRVRFVWNDYPLTQVHANSLAAAVAARCAQEQNKFWEYSQSLFENQKSWDALAVPSQKFIDMAKGLGLEGDNFTSCLGRSAPKDKVNQDMIEGQGLGIDSTPTFFINRKMYSGAMDFATWQKELDQALR